MNDSNSNFNFNDPNFQEGYALAQKKNRTPQDDKRLQELIEIGRKQDYNKAKGQAVGPTPDERSAKINEFLNLYKDKSSNRYNHSDKPTKRISSRYGAQEERYDFG